MINSSESPFGSGEVATLFVQLCIRAKPELAAQAHMILDDYNCQFTI